MNAGHRFNIVLGFEMLPGTCKVTNGSDLVQITTQAVLHAQKRATIDRGNSDFLSGEDNYD